LTDGRLFGELTALSAEISHEAGGGFSCFNGTVAGRQLLLWPGRKIVQSWRIDEWDPGVFSIVRIELRSEGRTTRLILDQSGFPPNEYEQLDRGWQKMYWDKLYMYLGEPENG
jgi:activator of HSP90 ATPase